MVALVVGAAVAAERPTRVPNLYAVILTAVITLGYIALLPIFPTLIDVYVFLTDGAAALLHGQNPYALTFPSIYSPEATAEL